MTLSRKIPLPESGSADRAPPARFESGRRASGVVGGSRTGRSRSIHGARAPKVNCPLKRGRSNYLVTAHHVYDDCGGDPSVRFRERWKSFQWEVVAEDKSLDVIVLKSPELPTDLERRLPVLYGVPDGTVQAQIGYSLGFPAVYESLSRFKTDHVLEVSGWPIPIATLLVVNLSSESAIRYSASYINAGFSGGAVVYYVAKQKMWTIAGIIVEFPAVPRPVYDVNGKETGGLVHQHTGLVGYVPMSAVLRLIDDAVGK